MSASVVPSSGDPVLVYRTHAAAAAAAHSGAGLAHSRSRHAHPIVDAEIPASPPFSSLLVVHVTQLLVLLWKNFLVLWRSKKAALTFIFLPCLLVGVIWIVQSRINAKNNVDHGGVDIEVAYQRCQVLDIYGTPDPHQDCVSVYYSPNDNPQVNAVMRALAGRTGLTVNVDIVGLPTILDVINTLASNIGRYDAAITFDPLPVWCPELPCDPELTEADKAEAVLAAEYAAKLNAVNVPVKDWTSCPITVPFNASYTLWLNGTSNANDPVPSWVQQNQMYFDSQSSQPVPPRYWALHQAINMAITDVMTAFSLPGATETLVLDPESTRFDRDASVASDPAESVVHVSLWSMFSGRTGSSSWSNGNNNNNDGSLAQYENDGVTKFAGSSIISIAVLVLTLLAMQFVAAEKQSRIVGILRIMGMNESNYWASWVGLFSVLAIAASLVATGLGRISHLKIWEYADFSIHFVALFLYIVAMCSMALLFTSFIQKPMILNIVGFLLFFSAVVCNAFFGNIYANLIYRPDLPNILQILFYIFPWFHFSKVFADCLQNTSLIAFTDKVTKVTTHVQYEYHWSQITQTQRIYAGCAYGDEKCCAQPNNGVPNCYDAPSTASAFGNLAILTSVYLFLAWYLAQVFGASLGMNRKPWFIFLPEFWGFDSDDDVKLAELQAMNNGLARAASGAQGQIAQKFLSQDRLVNEQFLSLRNNELRTYKLSKSYEKTSALKECTLKMHAGEVFCLLGHNGAGKSTLVNTLTGLMAPTFGNGWIFGHSLRNVHRIQREMGVCMQDDLLFDDLTTRETIRVFAAIRGIPFGQITATVNSKLAQFHMQSYADKQVRALSGGMKRRLSLSLATLGDPRIIFLSDEPTTGMDPVNRNKIWQVIRELKPGRIVVLTTHNMEEADFLGDTISLMSNGRMRAMGSALFLKNRYGAGYQLSLLINPLYHAQIAAIIKQLLPGCEIIHAPGAAAVTADNVTQNKQAQSAAQAAAAANGQAASSGHGNFTIGLKRKSLRALPTFFRWLEQEEARYQEAAAAQAAAQRAASPAAGPPSTQDPSQLKVLREWSLSNSTLEEVFLRLCANEKNINERIGGQSAEADDEAEMEAMAAAEAAAVARELEEEAGSKCMLCKERPTMELVTLYSKAGLAVDFANLLCAHCSHSKEAIQLVGGSNPAVADASAMEPSAPLASPVPGEDDAPIQLSMDSSSSSNIAALNFLPTPSQQHGGAPVGPGGYMSLAQQAPFDHQLQGGSVGGLPESKSSSKAAQKGVNNELDIANNEEQFHEAWDSLGHAPPATWAQIRAVYLKNAALVSKEKKSSCCKIVVLGVLAFIVMYQTTGTQSQCPGGWIPADQHGWPTDPNNLPCSFLNVTSRFGAQWNNPIVPFPQPSYPGSSFYSTQALDVYDCTLNESRQQIWPCGFVPQWKVDPDNMQQLVLITSDPIVSASQQQNTPNEAAPIPSSVRAGGLMRSPVDLPLSEWSIPAPVNLWFSSSWIAFVHIEVNDQTENLIAGFARTLPWQPTGYIDQNPSPPYGTPTPPLVINSASGTPPQPGTTVGSLDDIMWQSQLFVDANASVVTPTCKYWLQADWAVKLHYVSDDFDSQQASEVYMAQMFPSAGLDFLQSKPFPMRDGQRVNETFSSGFVPQLSFRMRYYETDAMPQQFQTISDDSPNNCRSVSPQGLSSSDVTHQIHLLTNAFLLTRMQSLWTNRLDIGRDVHFTPYFDNLVSNSSQSICPNPFIRTQIVQFPGVQFLQSLSSTSISLALGMIIFLSLLNLPNSVSHILYERENQLLHMMRISGMRDAGYWAANYLWEFTVQGFWFAALLIFGVAYGSPIFTKTAIAVWIGVCICFIHYSICLSWLLASLFNSKRIGLVVSYLLVVVATFLAIILDQYLDASWSLVYLYIPPLAYAKALSTIIRYNPQGVTNEHQAQLLTAVLIMVFEGLLLGLVGAYANICRYRGLGLFVPRFIKAAFYRAKGGKDNADSKDVELNDTSYNALSGSLLSKADRDEPEDIDCAAERAKVNMLVTKSPDNYPAILLHNLHKIFGGTKVAVNQLCLSVEYGECFGLLGPNGAGKSTTLSILTSLLDATSGSAYLCGFDLQTKLDSVFSILGICPQFDQVWDSLTVYEHLLFYARLKGVASSWEKGLVQYIAELTELDGDPLNKPAESLSGGMKRRLSLGISLIGNPKIWLLDEPTTGLSPETRREIWSIIEKRKRRSRSAMKPGELGRGKSIILTTHSMEEADTLCDRIAILANGGLQCLGSAAHLKSRFGEGFKLTLHMQHEFEQRAVEEVMAAEARAAAHAAARAQAGGMHEPGVLEQKDASVSDYSSILFEDADQKARVAQHVSLVRFIRHMAPHAKLSSVVGKNVQFRLHPDDKAATVAAVPMAAPADGSTSSSSDSAAGPESSKTAEVLGIFNSMEAARGRLLSAYGIEEWGLSQSSLEEVFLSIVSKFEQDDNIPGGAFESKKTK